MPCNSSSFCLHCIESYKWSHKQQNPVCQNKGLVTNAFYKIAGVILTSQPVSLPSNQQNCPGSWSPVAPRRTVMFVYIATALLELNSSCSRVWSPLDTTEDTEKQTPLDNMQCTLLLINSHSRLKLKLFQNPHYGPFWEWALAENHKTCP